ncbi:MAG TPA: hypothetical protein PK530_13230 [Anaerolineales bacterium]|nr:hypothetical protein [Anaerolineales bacterium]
MLSWQFSLNETYKLLIIQTQGVLEIQQATLMRTEGAALIREHNLVGGLLDHTGVIADALGTMDIYELPKRYLELGIPRRFRLAVVIPSKLQKNMEFYENVCRNNGYQVSIFFDREEAMHWLTQ